MIGVIRCSKVRGVDMRRSDVVLLPYCNYTVSIHIYSNA